MPDPGRSADHGRAMESSYAREGVALDSVRQLVPNRHLKICLSSLGSYRNNPRETSPPKQSEWCCTPRYLEDGVPPSETMSTLWPTD